MKLFYVMGGIRREGEDTYNYTIDNVQCNVENRTQDEGWGWGLVRVSVVPDPGP